jgi:hypothetical protein
LSPAGTDRGPFLIAVALADGTTVEIPAGDHPELVGLLGRMSKVCEDASVPTPAIVVWRLDRGEPRPMTWAELEECGLHESTMLSGPDGTGREVRKTYLTS